MTILRDALASLRTVRVITVPADGDCSDVHYVALVEGDRVLAEVGPGSFSEAEAETVAEAYAAFMGWPVSRRDMPGYVSPPVP